MLFPHVAAEKVDVARLTVTNAPWRRAWTFWHHDVEVMKVIPQERVSERVVERIVAVPHLEVMLVPDLKSATVSSVS